MNYIKLWNKLCINQNMECKKLIPKDCKRLLALELGSSFK